MATYESKDHTPSALVVNLGNGRTRTAMYIDSIEQLRGTAGERHVNVKAETAICAYAPAGSMGYLCLSNAPP